MASEPPRREVYPKVILVKGKPWRIVFHTKGVMLHRGERVRGLCDPNSRTITLYARLGPKMLLSTFAHELVHAFEFEYGINIPHRLVFQIEMPLARFVLENGLV